MQLSMETRSQNSLKRFEMSTPDPECFGFVKMNFEQAIRQVRTDEFARTYIFFVESFETYNRMKRVFHNVVGFLPLNPFGNPYANKMIFPILINVFGDRCYSGTLNASTCGAFVKSLLWYSSHKNVAKYVIPTFDSFQICRLAELF